MSDPAPTPAPTTPSTWAKTIQYLIHLLCLIAGALAGHYVKT
jgi:hypothetical protein